MTPLLVHPIALVAIGSVAVLLGAVLGWYIESRTTALLEKQLAERDADLAAARATSQSLSALDPLDPLDPADLEAEWQHELARRDQAWQEKLEAEIARLNAELRG